MIHENHNRFAYPHMHNCTGRRDCPILARGRLTAIVSARRKAVVQNQFINQEMIGRFGRLTVRHILGLSGWWRTLSTASLQPY